MFLTEAKETAKGKNCVGNLAGQLVDHHALDNADLFARWSANRRSLDTIACDQEPWRASPESHGVIIGLSRLLRVTRSPPRRGRAAAAGSNNSKADRQQYCTFSWFGA